MSCKSLKHLLPMALAGLLFAAMLLYSSAAVAGAAQGLALCANVIAPTLLPFFVLSNLLCALGLPGYLGRWTEGLFRALFGVGGAGASAFLLGLTGGYPLGAAAVAELYRTGSIPESEARRLLLFCNNTGPAFIMGMAGAGIFHSSRAGLLLYAAHALAAGLVGMALCRGGESKAEAPSAVCALDLSSAVTDAMLRSVKSTAMISGYVIFFSMLTALMRQSGLFTLLAGLLYEHTPLSIGQSQSAVLGILELGSGIASLSGLTPTPGNLALCAFILGWGGLSVQFQTAAVLSGAGLGWGSGAAAKALHGVLSAVLAFGLAVLLF